MHTGSLFIMAVAAVVSIAQGPSSGAEQAQKQTSSRPVEWFKLTVGSQWTYELVFSEPGSVLYDPYITNSVVLSSSVTHGTGKERPAGSTTLSVRAVAPGSASSVAVELNDDARRFWFAPGIKEATLVLVPSTADLPPNHPWRAQAPFAGGVVALELHGVMDYTKPTPDPWIIGQTLAVVPADGKSRVEKDGWLVERLTTPVTVPAGTFSPVIHSRMPRGTDPVSPFQREMRPAPHVVESWVAAGAGLIRSTVATSDGRVLYELRLASYKPGTQ